MKTIFFLFLLIALFSVPTQAQTDAERFSNQHRSFFHLYQPRGNDISFGYLLEPDSEEEGGPGAYEFQQFDFKATFISPLSLTEYASLSLAYGQRRYNFDIIDAASTRAGSEILHRSVVSLGIGSFLGEQTLFKATLDFGNYSDLDGGLETDDFRINAGAELIYRLNPGAQLIGGVLASEDFEDQEIIPLLGLRLISDDGALHISLTAPKEIQVIYRLDNTTELYAGGWLMGERYRVSLGPDNKKFDIRYQDRRLGLGLVQWLGSNTNIEIEGGYSLSSELEFHTPNPGQFSGDLDYAPYLRAQLGFAF